MDFTIPVIISLAVAGPIIGSFIGILKRPTESFMFVMLAFAGGVMLAISFLQLIPESIHLSSQLYCAIGIMIGVIIMYGLDKLIPHIHPEFCKPDHGLNLKRTAIYLILGISLHNIPEGMAIGLGLHSETISAYIIAIAIGFHDIPEAICTSAPYYCTSKNRLKSFLLSSSTAIPTVIGFLLALFTFNYISDTIVGVITGATAGIMIYITADEIIPTAFSESLDHKTIFSLIFGIIFVILLGIIL